MPSISPIPSEADVIFNRASVALAKSQRLIASWLPPPTASELANAKPQDEVEREEQEMFTPIPELLGLGASVPQESEAKMQKQDTEEKLRRQLLGKDYKKLQTKHVLERGKNDLGHSQLGSKSRPKLAKPKAEVDSDAEGRTSLGKSKRSDRERLQHDDMKEARVVNAPRLPKRSNNYLDEVLAEKALKKSKKSRKNRITQQAETGGKDDVSSIS